MILRRRLVLIVGPLALATACAAACTPWGTTSPTTASSASAGLDGAHVNVVGLWSGPELDSFRAVVSAWEEDTGGTVDWEGTQDIARVLSGRVDAGDPPDIAILPNPGLMHELARDGSLVPLDSVLDVGQVEHDYSAPWIELGSDAGELYGIPYKVTNKATVWFDPKAFAAAGYTVPATWDDLTALADAMVADGRTPFSVVAPSGPGSGWALTDWVAQIVLNACGPDVYDAWVAAEIPWTDACIWQSFERFDAIVHTQGYVLGGTPAILATSDADGVNPLYTDPPTAYLYYLASFAQGFIGSTFPDATPGDDYGYFPFPAIDPAYAGGVTAGADVVVMMADTPAARSFMTYLAGAEAQEVWVELGGFTSVNRSVSPESYPDPVARSVADDLTGAEVVRFGAGDMMPAAVQRLWWKGMLVLVEDPAKLEALLGMLTGAARSAG